MTAVEFRTAFPEFATEKDDVIERHIADADEFFDAARWGGLYARGLGHWAAHSIVMEKRRVAAGPVALAGDVTSKSMSTPTHQSSMSRSSDAVKRAQEDPYYESAYGREYRRLLVQVGMGVHAL